MTRFPYLTTASIHAFALPFDYGRVKFDPQLHGPKSNDEMMSADLLRTVGFMQGMYLHLLSKRRPEHQSHVLLAREYMSMALVCAMAGAQELMSLDASGRGPVICSGLREVVSHAWAMDNDVVDTPFAKANGLIGLAARAMAEELGAYGEHVSVESGRPTFTAKALNLFFPSGELLATFRLVDADARVEITDGTWVVPEGAGSDHAGPSPVISCKDARNGAALSAEDADTSTSVETTSATDVGIIAAAAGGTQADVAPFPANALVQSGASTSVAIAEEAPIAILLDAFENSAAAPSSKPHITRPTVRIFLHELGLTEQDPVAALRSTLTGAGASFRRSVVRRSEHYGMTARMGKVFNNPGASPAGCLAQAKDAKKRKLPGWQRLNAEQGRDRLDRWTAWVAFLEAADFEGGPLPEVQW